MTVHAETSRFNQTVYDAHVNLLRSQTEAMSAALAGVDSITVTPFDTPYKTPDEFSERNFMRGAMSSTVRPASVSSVSHSAPHARA